MFCQQIRMIPKDALMMVLASSLAHVSGSSSRQLSVADVLEEDNNDETPILKWLATTFNINQSSTGAMFDMKAKVSIVIRCMDINTIRTPNNEKEARVEIWTKKGSFVDTNTGKMHGHYG